MSQPALDLQTEKDWTGRRTWVMWQACVASAEGGAAEVETGLGPRVRRGGCLSPQGPPARGSPVQP